MEIEIGLPAFCPVCGSQFDVKEGVRYCPHVLFIHVWGDPDFFIHVTPEFADAYLERLKASPEWQEYLEVTEAAIDEDTTESFRSAKFDPMDEASTAIPFFKELANRACPKNSIVFSNTGHYSGVHWGINCNA